MPRISAFYGIVIAMYYNDHRPAHFHARYGEYRAVVEIATGDVLRGELPARASRLVREWAELHRAALQRDWELVMSYQPPLPIQPLP